MARGQADISVREIAAMLNERAATLAPRLLPHGRRAGGFWETSSIDDVKTGKYSLKVNVGRGRIGLWTDFGADQGSADYSGDMLSLVALREYGGDLGKAIAWAKSFLGLDDADPARIERVRREAREADAKADAAAEAEKAKMRSRAYALWRGAIGLHRTPAEAYLRGRGIDFAQLGRVPGALRYRPDVWCRERGGKFPAMVACIMALDGSLMGVHRTYLDISGWDHAARQGVVTKAAVADAKLSMGYYQGGCIPLWKGACRKTLREIDAGTPIYISEGIEDGLSVAMAKPDARIVAGVALANIGGLVVPEQAGPVVLIGQNDPLNSKAVNALERAVARQQEAGRKVQLMFPPDGYKDFNDLLMGKRK
ncbi:toprim domain-containing protein [Sphingomonas flavalba]|uniref:DUF7146 domain-containing protein n=1 Tax=Sphingomonas flavalba TaxID=2559804 RepID=UPI0039E04198